MGLKLYVSNYPENLAEQFIHNMNDKKDIFSKDYIITQTGGMQQWLCIHVAERNNIFSNFVFLSPGDLINEIYTLLDGNKQILSPWVSIWIIFNSLDSNEFKQEFKTIATYYHEDSLKRIQLSQKIADLFDQYQVYRPDYITLWNNDKHIGLPHEKWQKWLWNDLKKKSTEHYIDKTELSEFIMQQLKVDSSDKSNLLKEHYDKVVFFGFSTLTKYHLQLICKLSEVFDIEFYLTNPAPHDYWFEDKSPKDIARWEKIFGKKSNNFEFEEGNPLLTAFGKNLSDLYLNLFEFDEFINNLDDHAANEPNPDSLLSCIQNDIFNNYNKNNQNKPPIKFLNDQSISISSCYTEQREVEVLYNHLVSILDIKKEKLLPKDILILVPDIDEYASYISASFDNALYKIPYYIADRTYKSDDTISGFISELLNIADDKISSEQVLQLMYPGIVQNKFGFSDYNRIRYVIEKANIRYGMKGNKKDDSYYISWSAGIEKIILGIALYGDEGIDINHDTIYPLDILEGEQSREMLRVIAFLNILFKIIQDIHKPKTLNEWKEFVSLKIINQLIDVNDENEDEYKYIVTLLQRFEDASRIYSFPITHDIFRHIFNDSIQTGSRSGNFINGKVTFCSAIPLRSIPYKYIGFLGLNKDKFPRKTSELGFDLMTKAKRRGDRNIKDNDKHLFLETLLAARKYLYLSYIGKDPANNNDVSPSILLDELMDYIESYFPENKSVKEHIVTEHPLHGFSKKYFDQNQKRFFTYLGDEKTDIINLKSEKNVLEYPEPDPENLIQFYNNPVKYYFNHILNIYYEQSPVSIPEYELFETDHLQSWILKNNLLEISNENIEQFKDKAKKTGMIPLKNLANVTINQKTDEISQIKAKYDEIKGNNPCRTEEVCFKDDQRQICGILNQIYGNMRLEYCLSRSVYKYLLQAWIRHLFSIASNLNINTILLFQDGSELEMKADIISIDEAEYLLKELIEYYEKGCREIIIFHPKAAFEWTKKNQIKNVWKKFDELCGEVSEIEPDPYFKEIYHRNYLASKFNQSDFERITELIYHEQLKKLI